MGMDMADTGYFVLRVAGFFVCESVLSGLLSFMLFWLFWLFAGFFKAGVQG